MLYLSMNIRGQNVIEYVLLVVSVMIVCILFLGPNGKFKQTLENSLTNLTLNRIDKASAEIKFNP